MWKCVKCGTLIEDDNFDSCWNCNTEKNEKTSNSIKECKTCGIEWISPPEQCPRCYPPQRNISDKSDGQKPSSSYYCASCDMQWTPPPTACPKCKVEGVPYTTVKKSNVISTKPVYSLSEKNNETPTTMSDGEQRYYNGYAPGGSICPFSWIEVAEKPGCLGSIFGAKPHNVWKAQQCLGASCRLWDSRNSNCAMVTNR